MNMYRKRAHQQRGLISALAIVAIAFVVLIVAATFQISAQNIQHFRQSTIRAELVLLEQSAIDWVRSAPEVTKDGTTLNLGDEGTSKLLIARVSLTEEDMVLIESEIRNGDRVVGRLKTKLPANQTRQGQPSSRQEESEETKDPS